MFYQSLLGRRRNKNPGFLLESGVFSFQELQGLTFFLASYIVEGRTGIEPLDFLLAQGVVRRDLVGAAVIVLERDGYWLTRRQSV